MPTKDFRRRDSAPGGQKWWIAEEAPTHVFYSSISSSTAVTVSPTTPTQGKGIPRGKSGWVLEIRGVLRSSTRAERARCRATKRRQYYEGFVQHPAPSIQHPISNVMKSGTCTLFKKCHISLKNASVSRWRSGPTWKRFNNNGRWLHFILYNQQIAVPPLSLKLGDATGLFAY